MIRQCTLSIFLLAVALETAGAFAPTLSLQRPVSQVLGAPTRLYMSEEPEMSAEEPATGGEGEEEVPEDPELVALKEEIATLERDLKSKQSTLAYSQDQVEEYSKSGYARKVAEMENMRRVRSSMNSSSRSSATAGALVGFLPIYDKFAELKEKYADEEFGNKYVSLSMEATFSKMGVTEYAVETGQALDNFRIAVVETEYSTDVAKDTIIRPIASGLELEGNVIRAALCVASAGAEEQAVSDEQE